MNTKWNRQLDARTAGKILWKRYSNLGFHNEQLSGYKLFKDDSAARGTLQLLQLTGLYRQQISSVSIVTRIRANEWRSMVRLPVGARGLSLLYKVKRADPLWAPPSFHPTQCPPVVNRPWREATATYISFEVKMDWSYTPAPANAFMTGTKEALLYRD